MGLGSLFGGGSSTVDNSGAFDAYANAMRQRGAGWNGWVDTGDKSRDQLYGQYGDLINNPNGVQDRIAAGYAQSPYEKYLEDMVTKRMNYNSANTGMLNSGAAQRALQEELTGMTGQFMNGYIDRGMNSYQMGLGGLGGLADMGFRARDNQDALYGGAAEAQLKGDMSRSAYDAANRPDWGGIIGGAIGTGAGAYFGGPQGAAMGGQMGSQMFGRSGGNTNGNTGSSGNLNQMFPNGFNRWSGWNRGASSTPPGGGWGETQGDDFTNSGNWSY